MPDEALITQIENLFAEIVELGGQNEQTGMAPNLTVQDANPANLTGFVIVSDDRDGDNILAKKVGSVIYADNDLVNVMFLKGGEAIAFQQGSQSANNGIWEIVPSTTTDIFYDKGDVGIGKSVAPDASLEILDTAQPQLRLTFEDGVKFADLTSDTNHHLTIDPSSTGQIKLNATITVIDEIQHEGDVDNKIGFTDDIQTFTVGGEVLLTLTEAVQDVVKIGDGGDVDINFNDDMFLQGSDGFLGVGTIIPDAQVNIKSPSTPADNVVVFSLDDSADQERTEINSTGIQGWNLHSTAAEAGRITYATPGGNPGIVLFTGSPGSYVNRFDIFNNGTTFELRYNADSFGLTLEAGGNVAIGRSSAFNARLYVDQRSTTAAQPPLAIDQADISEEMIEFVTTIGTGNAIEAVGAKTLTVTHFIKVTLPGALTRYIEVGTIA